MPECLSFDVCFFAPDSPHRTRQPHSQQKPSNVLDGALVSRKRRNGSQTTWPDVPPKRGATGELALNVECGFTQRLVVEDPSPRRPPVLSPWKGYVAAAPRQTTLIRTSIRFGWGRQKRNMLRAR